MSDPLVRVCGGSLDDTAHKYEVTDTLTFEDGFTTSITYVCEHCQLETVWHIFGFDGTCGV